jgi:ligand-binding sensor domain-containing protein
MSRRLICLPILLLIVIFPPPASGQDHIYTHYDAKDGLVGSTVYSMAEDKDGFMWFGTETGLSRFDGTHFSNFTTADGLPDNEIIKLKVDSKNRVWLVPFKNSIAYCLNGKIHNQQNDPLLRRIKVSTEIHEIVEDKSGNILISESNSIHIIGKDGKITEITGIFGMPFAVIYSGLDSTGRFKLMLSDFREFFVTTIDSAGMKCSRLPFPAAMRYVFTFLAGNVVINNIDGILHFVDPDLAIDFRIPAPPGLINLSPINDSLSSINTYNGVYLVNLRQKKITDSFLTGHIVNWVSTDAEGDLWFSTMGNGAYRLGSTSFINYPLADRGNPMPVFCINRFDSTLYVGTERFEMWLIGPKGKDIRKEVLQGGGTTGRIVSMVQRGNGDIILGTDGGVMVLRHGKRVASFPGLPVKSVLLDSDSTLLACNGLHALQLRLKDLSEIKKIVPFRSTCGHKKDGLYYIGTLDGLLIVDARGRIEKAGDRDILLRSRITDIQESPDGTLWIATNGEGLVGYKDRRTVANIRDSDGLTSNICRKLFISGNDIWVGTDKGLNKISPSPGGYKTISFTSLDGLNSDIINAIYVEGHRVFVGTAAGMTSFDETAIGRRSECRLKLTGIGIGGHPVPGDTSNFVVPHKENDIQFDFVGISFKSAANIEYKYRLSGVDPNWRTTTRNSLSYLSLPSGPYELELQAINKFGVHSEMVHIPFTIDKLFWERTWFRVAVGLTLAGMIWLAFVLRVRFIKRKEEEKSSTISRMAELEQMALRSQMNPHFIFNCLNSIQQYVLDKDVIGVNEFITNFSRLIRQTLDLSSRSLISLQEEICYLSTYLELEKRRFEDRFDYRVEIGEEVRSGDYQIPPMILQPYVENAIRHGMGLRKDNQGMIHVGISLRSGALVCSVEDNGVGRKRAGQFRSKNAIEYQSKGMFLTEKRIAMFNRLGRSPVRIRIEDLETDRKEAMGTRVTLFFPLDEQKINLNATI